MAEETKKAVERGHVLLIRDLEAMLDRVKRFEYHDFKNDIYATPKAVLHAQLSGMAQAVIDGKYDN